MKCKLLKEFILNKDLIGRSISLNLFGKETYQTILGGIISIIVKIIFIYVFLNGFVKIINRSFL